MAGIALFFIELYNLTDKNPYLEIAAKTLESLNDDHVVKLSPAAAFFTGRLGVATPILRAWELTGDNRFREMAALLSQPFLDGGLDFPLDDVLNGRAGAVLGLLRLHRGLDDDRFLPVIEREIGLLLKAAHLDGHGNYWDRDSGHISGLRGFSHGAAGIGHVFMEAGRYLESPGLYETAARAFAYETNRFIEGVGWPDPRKSYLTEAEQQSFFEHYRQGDRAFFNRPGIMNAWCHGAPGIGLSRIRAYELTGRDLYLEQYRQAVDCYLKKLEGLVYRERIDLTYCHGLCGDWDLLLEGYRVLGESDLLEPVAAQASEIIKRIHKGSFFASGYPLGEDVEELSLFMGLTGIGHALLRAADPFKTPSILCPTVAKSFSQAQGHGSRKIAFAGLAPVRERLLHRSFKSTLNIFHKSDYRILKYELERAKPDSDPVKALRAAIKQAAREMDRDKYARLRDIFALESAGLLTDLRATNHA